MPEWRAVVGSEGRYEVSDDGQVRSLTFAERTRSVPKILKQRVDKDGYPRLNVIADGKHVTWRVHQIVARAFLGECPSGMVPDHINKNRADNRASNLRYLCVHANGSKFSLALAQEARRLREAGMTLLAISQQTGISKSHVRRICLGSHRTTQ